jgi:dTDP-4-dehydrorhamnose reductase
MEKHCLQQGFEVCALTSGILDITDQASVQKKVAGFQPGIIINCAAYNNVDRAENEWKRAFMVNGIGPRNLALAAKKTGAIFVHYSTDYDFDGQKNTPYTIADLPRPIHRYGESKLLGEQMVRDHADLFLLIRTSWVFGAGNTNFVQKVLEWSRQGKELKMVTDQVSSPTYTADLARATLDLIGSGSFGLFHLTNSGCCSRHDWAEYILHATGWNGRLLPATVKEFPTPAQRPAYSVLDNFGFREVLGYDMPGWEDATLRYLHEVNAI